MRRLFAVFLTLASARAMAASEGYEFTAEHLPEVAMDNRFNTLPLWSGGAGWTGPWQFTTQGGIARTGSGRLTLDGPMLSASIGRRLTNRQSAYAFGFFDQLRFSGTNDQRPLVVLFTDPPLALPASSLFTDLHGTYRNIGAGLAFNLEQESDGWLGDRQWVMGALYQRVSLSDYRANYRVLEGSSSGASGFIDYSANYHYVTPFVGLLVARDFDSWSVAPHALFALPIPNRAVEGRITGPGFDLSGDTQKAGHGKHFGDDSRTFGLDVTYKPWGLTVDAGGLVLQALLEPLTHGGIDQNWLISVHKQF